MGASYSHADAPVRTAFAPQEADAENVAASAAEASAAAARPDSGAGLSSDAKKKFETFSESVEATKGYWWWGFERSELQNPGAYDEMSTECNMILRQNLIEGLSFNMQLPVSQSVQLGQSFDLGSKDRPGMFAACGNYFSNNLVIMSRLSPSDERLNTRAFWNHTPTMTSKINADVGLTDPTSSKGSWDLDYRGSDFCAQAKVASGGIYALSYLQSVTPWLALGGEGFYQSKTMFSAITAAAKYSHGADTATVSIATFGPIMASFVHRLNPRVAFATEFFMDGRTSESHVSVGYRFDLRSATVTGVVDSSGRVSATVEEKINPGLALILSGELDHRREDYKFGFGVNIGPQ